MQVRCVEVLLKAGAGMTQEQLTIVLHALPALESPRVSPLPVSSSIQHEALFPCSIGLGTRPADTCAVHDGHVPVAKSKHVLTGGALGLAPVAQAFGDVCAVWPDWLLEQLQAVQGCLLLQCQMSEVRFTQPKLLMDGVRQDCMLSVSCFSVLANCYPRRARMAIDHGFCAGSTGCSTNLSAGEVATATLQNDENLQAIARHWSLADDSQPCRVSTSLCITLQSLFKLPGYIHAFAVERCLCMTGLELMVQHKCCRGAPCRWGALRWLKCWHPYASRIRQKLAWASLQQARAAHLCAFLSFGGMASSGSLCVRGC